MTCTHSSSRGTTIGSVKSGMQILVQSIPSGSESNESVLNKVSPFHYCWSPGPSPLLSGGRGPGLAPFIVTSPGPSPSPQWRKGPGLASIHSFVSGSSPSLLKEEWVWVSPLHSYISSPLPLSFGGGAWATLPPFIVAGRLLVLRFYLMLGCNATCLLELREDVLVCHCRFAKLWKCWPPRIG